MRDRSAQPRILMEGLWIPFLLALIQLAVQVLFHNNYGYFRDELYYIACSNHLDYGYVDQPPLSIVLLWVSRHLLGDSLQAIRLLPSLAGGGVIILGALTVRKLGGGKYAQALAALSVVASHELLGKALFFSMNPFDVLFWALALYTVVIILVENKPKLWILFGIIVGLGLENKYSIGFLCIGLVIGLLLTRERKELATAWFWLGAAMAFLVFLPHIIWEIRHGLPSLEFMRNASQYKNVNLSALAFFFGQLRNINAFNAPIWLGGIYYFLFSNARLRPLAWLYPAVFVAMVLSNAKIYYLSPIYPVYLAGGSIAIEQLVRKRSWAWVKATLPVALIVSAIMISPFAIPILPVSQFVRYEKFLHLAPRVEERTPVSDVPQYYADQFGWEEMVALVGKAYQKLTPAEQAQCVIYVRNYGEAGAIDFFGKHYGLPAALCPHNSYWLWGPGLKTGDVAIVLGGAPDLQGNLRDLSRRYRSVEFTDTTHAEHAMPFENGRGIFICKGMNTTFQKIWAGERFYY